ncbi:hypothetical protein K402DRAFT_455443 [Aulographum hederae CBS 113979]|uniref:DUF3835 domain-containing protein n=1 Tax=Aulographum hederae CBS 113979 TaxID=1176131 RepID=A0A6G1GVK6_9PEZI|nr:hypothetical protein K402DRAFT_455443 [Aulographum hederae CBS 113979]
MATPARPKSDPGAQKEEVARVLEALTKLQDSLKHWQTWEAEYAVFKEEIESLPEGATGWQIQEIRKQGGYEVFTDLELEEVMGLKDFSPHIRDKMIRMVTHRLEYTEKNVATLQKQVDATEKQYNALLTESNPEDNPEEGLLLTEITEELDDDDNVISSTVSHPDDAQRIADALRKAGKTNSLQDEQNESEATKEPEDQITISKKLDDDDSTPRPVSALRGALSQKDDSQPPKPKRKKSVAFAPKAEVSIVERHTGHIKPSKSKPIKAVKFAPKPDVKVIERHEQRGGRVWASNNSGKNIAAGVDDFMFKKGSHVLELGDEEEVLQKIPVMPEDQDPEEAASRSDMLEYGLNEVGAVVAEMQLEEVEDSDDWAYEDENEDSDVESDDEYGMSRRSQIPDEYHKQMVELETKFNARMMENVGPAVMENVDPNLMENVDPNVPPEVKLAPDTRRLVVHGGPVEQNKWSQRPELAADKEDVESAIDRGVSLSPGPSLTSDTSITSAQPKVVSQPTVVSNILERPSSYTNVPTAPSASTRRTPLAFKKARGKPVDDYDADLDTDSTTASGPRDTIVAASVLERASKPAAEPSDFDAAIVDRQLGLNYNMARNRMIQKEGGFSNAAAEEDEEEKGVLMEERGDGKVRRVSRFKAARLKEGGA